MHIPQSPGGSHEYGWHVPFRFPAYGKTGRSHCKGGLNSDACAHHHYTYDVAFLPSAPRGRLTAGWRGSPSLVQ
eukprot:6169095-Pyramimonas_sp.AAC.1